MKLDFQVIDLQTKHVFKIAWRWRLRRVVVVRVTDADGVEGWGEASSLRRLRAVSTS